MIGDIGRKSFMKYISNTERSHAAGFWSRKFDDQVPEDMFDIPFKCTKESRLRVLQWKILNNIYPTNILLAKMGIAQNDNCNFCEEKDFIEHFFFYCKSLRAFWAMIEGIFSTAFGKMSHLTPKQVLLGVKDKKLSKDEENTINHILLIAKMCISKFKYGKPTHLISLFRMECQIRNLQYMVGL